MPQDLLDQQSQIANTSLQLLLQEIVPTSIRVSKQVLNLSATNETKDEQTRIDKELSKIRDDLPGTVNVFDSQFLQQNSDEITLRIETYGFNLGWKIAEVLLYKNSRTKIVDILDIMKFVCRDVWKCFYDKQMDNLRTNHRGTFVLVDNNYKLINQLNSPRGAQDTLDKAKLYMWFPCGVIKGILMSFGVEAQVAAEITQFPSVIFNIHTTPPVAVAAGDGILGKGATTTAATTAATTASASDTGSTIGAALVLHLHPLILEDTRIIKRSKPSTPVTSPGPSPVHTPRSIRSTENLNYLFKLSRTEDNLKSTEASEYADIERTILAEASAATAAAQTGLLKDEHGSNEEIRQRRFIIQPDPQTLASINVSEETGEDLNLPNELSNMVEDYIALEPQASHKRKKRGNAKYNEEPPSNPEQVVHFNEDSQLQDSSTNTTEEDNTDYVFDVYHLSEPLTSANHPTTQIGYIRFFDDDDENQSSFLLNNEEDEQDRKPSVLTDDEDSNAESFYQNDYPSDEDAEGLEHLDSFDEEFDKLKIGDYGNLQGGDGEENDEDEDVQDVQGYEPRDGIGFSGDDEYLDYDEMERYMNLKEEEEEEEEEEDDVEEDDDLGEEKFKRNRFFKSDDNDPIAMHRDRIFGELERMIKKAPN
ncbi:TRS33 [Candida oxycetoniae]|uniref:TRS33 n=1 Tax=Candida oxycetoniae TaxID=497107 RepID=A0AAI9SY55_9ASCO|nr:TRS33 [Candida oxycetoniae]KAI3405138.2 TRS33 [Candida oxycetoniae]